MMVPQILRITIIGVHLVVHLQAQVIVRFTLSGQKI